MFVANAYARATQSTRPPPGTCSAEYDGRATAATSIHARADCRAISLSRSLVIRAVSVDNNNNSTTHTFGLHTMDLVCVCASVTHSRIVCSAVADGSLFLPCAFADVQQGVVRTRRCGNRILAKCVLYWNERTLCLTHTQTRVYIERHCTPLARRCVCVRVYREYMRACTGVWVWMLSMIVRVYSCVCVCHNQNHYSSCVCAFCMVLKIQYFDYSSASTNRTEKKFNLSHRSPEFWTISLRRCSRKSCKYRVQSIDRVGQRIRVIIFNELTLPSHFVSSK